MTTTNTTAYSNAYTLPGSVQLCVECVEADYTAAQIDANVASGTWANNASPTGHCTGCRCQLGDNAAE